MAYWRYNQNARRYYVTAEGAAALNVKAGTFIGAARLVSLRDELVDKRRDRVTDLVGDLAAGKIGVNTFGDAMRGEIRAVTIAQYLLGRGGRGSMGSDDWGRTGGLIASQNRYLLGFLQRIREQQANGVFSEKQTAMIARMYMSSSTRAFEMATTAARGLPTLPRYPGDGQTRCLTNCRCRWKITDRRSDWLCYWVLGAAEHCEDCIELARLYNPLIIPKPIEMRIKR